MFTKFIKRSITTIGLTAITVGMFGLSPAQADQQASTSTTQVSEKPKPKAKQKCIKSQEATASADGILSSTLCISLDLLKKSECLSRAVKREQQAPPADPKSVCKGKKEVTFKATLKTDPCPVGTYGGQATMRISFKQSVSVYAMAQSIASGNSSTFAHTKISIKDKVKGWTRANCVPVQIVTPPPPTVDACPEISGTQPPGTDCKPPVAYKEPTVNVAAKACVEKGQSQDVSFTVHNPNDKAYTLRSTFNGMTLADRQIGANASVTVTVPNQLPGPFSGSVLLVEIGKSASFSGETKLCPPVNENKPPTGEIVQWPAHLEPGEHYKLKFVGSDPEDGGSVELEYSVSGGAQIVSDADHPTICDIEGTNMVCTVWIKANASAGVEYEINLRVKDGSGNFSPVYTKTGRVEALPV